MRDVRQIITQDKDLDSFGPRETSSGNNPTCCLRLGLIMIMRESPVNRLFLCLTLEIVSSFLSLFGEPCPSLYKLEGRVTYGVQIGLGLLYYKWSPSLASFVEKYSLCFPHKPAHHSMIRPSINRPLGHRVLSLL